MTENQSQYKPGDIVWAFAYQGADRIKGKKLRQKPIQGMLLDTKYPDAPNDPTKPARYFVPFGTTGNPMWSKVIAASSRKYTDTEADAIKLYNDEIKREIQWYQNQVREMNQDLIPTLDTTKDSDGDYAASVPYRADLTISDREILDSILDDLIPKGSDENKTKLRQEDIECGELMTWEQFCHDVENRSITDYDGSADLIIDGRASSNNTLWLTTGMLYIFDKFLIPFDRVPEIFAGHEIQVIWYNK